MGTHEQNVDRLFRLNRTANLYVVLNYSQKPMGQLCFTHFFCTFLPFPVDSRFLHGKTYRRAERGDAGMSDKTKANALKLIEERINNASRHQFASCKTTLKPTGHGAALVLATTLLQLLAKNLMVKSHFSPSTSV